MTTCRDAITFAMLLTKVIAPGTDPEADESASGLACLQSFYDGLVSGGMFGRLVDRYKTDTYEAKEGERVTGADGVAITFPDLLDDCENGGSRPPRDLACIETFVDDVRTVKIWDRIGWVSLLELTLDDLAPLSSRSAMGLAAAFATSAAFAAMFGNSADIGPDVRLLGAEFMGNLSGKRGTTQDRTPADYY